MISKKELLKDTNISYGQLYRWKREGLIPDDWFVKVSVPTGQETYFDENLIIPRIKKIIELKDQYSLEEMLAFFEPMSKTRKYTLRELILINEIDPFILKRYASVKSSNNNQLGCNYDDNIFSLIDVIIIQIFSRYKDLINYEDYLNYDFSSISDLSMYFYVLEKNNQEKFILFAQDKILIDEKLKILLKIKIEDIATEIAKTL